MLIMRTDASKRYTDVATDTMLWLDLARTHTSHNGSGEHAHSIERALTAQLTATHALCACLVPPGRLLFPVVATAVALMGCFCNKLMNDSLVAK